MNKSGKTLTIFMVVIAILLISITAISVFFFIKEMERREKAEVRVEQLKVAEQDLQGQLKESNKKIFRFEEQLKEAKDRVEGLADEVEFQKGLREQTKAENKEIKKALAEAEEKAATLQGELTKVRQETDNQITALQEELKASVTRNKEIDGARAKLQEMVERMKANMQESGIADVSFSKGEETADDPELLEEETSVIPEGKKMPNVGLEKIVVATNPSEENAGKVISVDQELNFIIVSLGQKQGLKEGSLLSVFRGENQLGEIEVSRVLPEMAAANLIPPLKSQDVQKDDRVIIKEK